MHLSLESLQAPPSSLPSSLPSSSWTVLDRKAITAAIIEDNVGQEERSLEHHQHQLLPSFLSRDINSTTVILSIPSSSCLTIMDIVKQGYVRVRSKRLSLWKKRWIILRRASSKGPVRLEKYFDERSSRNVSHSPKLLFCNNVSNVCRLSSTVKVHSFAISFDSNTPDSTCKWFACDSGNYLWRSRYPSFLHDIDMLSRLSIPKTAPKVCQGSSFTHSSCLSTMVWTQILKPFNHQTSLSFKFPGTSGPVISESPASHLTLLLLLLFLAFSCPHEEN